MYCEDIEISVEDNPEEFFKFIRALKNLETFCEISIFNKEETKEIENLENCFQLPFFKEEFNFYNSLDYDDFDYDYRGYNEDDIFYLSNDFYM